MLNPGVSVTISETERIVAFTEEYAGKQLPAHGALTQVDKRVEQEVTLDAKVLESVPAYPARISVTALAWLLFRVKNARRVSCVREAIRRLVVSAAQEVIVVDDDGGLRIGRKHECG